MRGCQRQQQETTRPGRHLPHLLHLALKRVLVHGLLVVGGLGAEGLVFALLEGAFAVLLARKWARKGVGGFVGVRSERVC